VPLTATAATPEERAAFAKWLSPHLKPRGDQRRSRREFLRSLNRSDASTGALAAYERGVRLPMPETLRAMARFWRFNELEAFYRAGYFREFLADMASLVRQTRSTDPAVRASSVAMRALVICFPIRGEIYRQRGLRHGEGEPMPSWVIHITFRAMDFAKLTRIGGQRPWLLERACDVLYEKSRASGALDVSTRRLIAAEYVRAYVLEEFGDVARRFAQVVYSKFGDV
jgi:hypothetical protein